ncbi:hypothetical protein AAG906_020955 [Vitis piasezkii]
MYLQTCPMDHSSRLSLLFDQEIMGHDVEILAKGNLAIHTDEMEENLAHNDEMGGNLAVVTQSVMRATNNYVDILFTNENDDMEFYDEDEINEMNYDDKPPTNKASLYDGEHIMPSPMFKQLNWDAINSMILSLSHHVNCGMNPIKPQLWTVRCNKWQEGCNWRLRACRRKSHGMFEITKYAGSHTCRDHTTSIATLHQIVKDIFGYDFHYRRIWESKRKVMLRVFGDWDESYQAFPKWMNILQLTNPETKILLIATSIDANGHLFLLAFAIVEEESQDSWSWFLIALRRHVTQRERICLISNHHARINVVVRNPSVGWSPPHAQHRYCLRHVVSNFNDKFKNKVLKELAYRAR